MLTSLPLPILLLVVFLSGGSIAFFVSESVRARRTEPAERVLWYGNTATPEKTSDTLINAAVLRRAKELATTLADRTGNLRRIEDVIEAAGMKWRPGEVIVASLGLGISAFLLGLVLSGPTIAVLLGLIGLLALTGVSHRKAARRKKAFYEQLPDVLLLMSGALKAGYSLQQAVAAVGADAKPPASDEFKRTMAEVRLGASLDDALEALGRRIGIVDFEWSVLAIQIQREVGGNLAEILEIISATIRERERLRRQLSSLTAEGRLSAIVLGVLPLFLAVLLVLRSPNYLAPLYQTSRGLIMIVGSGVLMVIGVFWMRKIIRMEV